MSRTFSRIVIACALLPLCALPLRGQDAAPSAVSTNVIRVTIRDATGMGVARYASSPRPAVPCGAGITRAASARFDN